MFSPDNSICTYLSEKNKMILYSRKMKAPFEKVVSKVTQSLEQQGFGIVTDIDVQDAFLKNLKIGFRRYKILGACNPQLAYNAINLEANAGIMLPCHVVIQEHENGEVEISAINPLETRAAYPLTEDLSLLSREIGIRLRAAIDFIHREAGRQHREVISCEGNCNYTLFIPG
jgi:uncharacterized protein (DUF302 family)